MTTTRNVLAGAAVAAALLGAPVAASAAIITIGGIDVPVGATFKTTQIFQNTVAELDDELIGVGRVTEISDIGGNIIWQPTTTQQLNFVYTDYILVDFDIGVGGTTATTSFTGGVVTFYVNDVAIPLDSDPQAAIDFVESGTEWLNLTGAGFGLDPIDGDEVTLFGFINILGSDLADVTSGSGSGFLDVAAGPGLANEFFDTDSLLGGQDIVFESTFNNVNPVPAFPLRGSADFRSFVEVPEPATIGVLGLGLIALGLYGRRRQQAA